MTNMYKQQCFILTCKSNISTNFSTKKVTENKKKNMWEGKHFAQLGRKTVYLYVTTDKDQNEWGEYLRIVDSWLKD